MKTLLLILSFAIMSFAAETFPIEVSKCATCHNLSDSENKHEKAPLMRNVVNNIKVKYDNKLDQKNFLYNFLEEPSKCNTVSRVLCEHHSTKKYGLMKDIKLTPMESLLIVNFLIDDF